MTGELATPTCTQKADLAHIQSNMRGIVDRTALLDLRVYEAKPGPVVLSELQPRVTELLRAARRPITELIAGCAQSSTTAEDSDLSHSGERSIWDSRCRELVEVAYGAALELGQQTQRLESCSKPTASAIALLSECDSALRTIKRSFCMVETALLKCERHLEPCLAEPEELEVGLAVRRLYARFRRRILEKGKPSSDQVRIWLRAAGTEVAMLSGRDEYPLMRMSDRLLVRGIQERIIAWLREPDASSESGLRVCSDLQAALDMMRLINHRQELIEHDRQVAESLLADLPNHGPLPSSCTKRLESLLGLDPELDQCLYGSPPPSCGALRSTLLRLARQTSERRPVW